MTSARNLLTSENFQPWLPWKSFRALGTRLVPKLSSRRDSPSRQKFALRTSLPPMKGMRSLSVQKQGGAVPASHSIRKPKLFPMVYRGMSDTPRFTAISCNRMRGFTQQDVARVNVRTRTKKHVRSCDFEISKWSNDGGSPRLSDLL